jgi:hypothetical protein
VKLRRPTNCLLMNAPHRLLAFASCLIIQAGATFCRPQEAGTATHGAVPTLSASVGGNPRPSESAKAHSPDASGLTSSGRACRLEAGDCAQGLDCLSRDSAQRVLGGVCVLKLDPLPDWTLPELDGAVVGFETALLVAGTSQTQKACPAATPCCNYSSGGMFVTSSAAHRPKESTLLLIHSNGDPYRCTGSNCEPFKTCSVPVGGKYRIIGRLVPLPQTASVEVELERVSLRNRALEAISISAAE